MTRLYFDLHDGPSTLPDLYGEEIECFEDAREQAQAILASFVVEKLPDGEARLFTCEVRDDIDIIYRCSLTLSGEVLRQPR